MDPEPARSNSSADPSALDPDALDPDTLDPDALPAGPYRRRPGRFRRWVLRPLLWGAAGLAVLLLGLRLGLETPWVRTQLSTFLAARLGALLDRQVTIADLSLELLPLTVEVSGFTISGIRPDDPPFLTVPWALVEADLDALENRVLRLRQVRVQEPQLNLEFFPDGESNVLQLAQKTKAAAGKKRRLDVVIERVEVTGARFSLDEKAVPLSISADVVQAHMEGQGHLFIAGQVAGQNVEVRLPHAIPQRVAVAARGSVQRGLVTIESARITAPGLVASAHGSCSWPRADPLDKKCSIESQGTAAGELLHHLGYFHDLRGDVDFIGTFDWRPRVFGWRSQLRGRELWAWDRHLQDVQGKLSADRYGLHFDLERATYAGGELVGTIDYEHRVAGQPVNVALDFQGLALDSLLADQRIPAQGFAATLAGHLDYRFPRLLPLHGDGQAEVGVAPGEAAPGLAVSGNAPLQIAGGIVRSQAINLQGARQSLLARGEYDLARETGTFEYEIASADVVELAQFLPVGERSPENPLLWLPTAGEGLLAGTLFLASGSATTDLRLELAKVATPSLRAAQLSGTLSLNAAEISALHLELGDAAQALVMRGKIPFVPEETAPIDLTFDGHAWPIPEIRPWLDFELPLEGAVSGHLELAIGRETSWGSLKATAAPGVLRLPRSLALPFDPTIDFLSLATQLDWDRDRLRVDNLALRTPAGTVLGLGTIDWTHARYDLEARGSGLELAAAPFVRYLPRADLNAQLDVSASLRGAFTQPQFAVAVVAREPRLGERPLGRGESLVELTFKQGRVHVQGHLLELISLAGGGTLARDGSELALEVQSRDLKGLLELALNEVPAEVGGAFRGNLRLQSGAFTVAPDPGAAAPAPSTAGPDLTLQLELAELAVDYRDRHLVNLEPVVLRLAPDHARISSLLLGEKASDSEFFLTGVVGYAAGAPLDLRLQATLAASWLQLYQPELEVAGFFDVLGRVGGTLAAPYLDGQAELRQARLMMPTVFPHSLEELGGIILFYPESVVIDRLGARLAGGNLEVAGQVALPRAGQPLDYSLQLSGRNLRLRYPEGWSLEGNAELNLKSTAEGQLLSGRTELQKIQYFQDLPVGLAQLLQGFFERQRLEVQRAAEVRSRTQLNLAIDAPHALEVRNNLANLAGSVDLVVRGNLLEPVLYGKVDIDPAGLLVYSGNDYAIERGRLTFANPYKLAPEVDLVATTKVREVEISLALSGTLERLDARFSSQPPLPDLEVFRLLSTGGDIHTDADVVRRFHELDEDQSTSAASFLYGQAASVIGDRVNSLFGFDKFRIDPLTGSGDNLSTARLTVGKRLSKDLFVSYSIDPSSTEDQRLRIEWQVSDGLTLILTQNGDDSYSADARWEKSF